MWGLAPKLGATPASHPHSTVREGRQREAEEAEKEGAQLRVDLPAYS